MTQKGKKHLARGRDEWQQFVTVVALTMALLALMNLMSDVSFLPLTNPWLLSGVAVAAAVWVEIQARCTVAEIRRFDGWGSLDIDAV